MAQRRAVEALRLLSALVDGIQRHHLTTQAAALTFTTVFSLVPTLAVGFAVFQAFGGIEEAKALLLPRILDYLAVGVRDQVETRIDEMLRTIHGGAIGAVGSLFLFGAVASLLSSIEDAFNRIWSVHEHRTLVRRLSVYWTMATLTPVLLIGGLSLPSLMRRIGPLQWLIDSTGSADFIFAGVLPIVFVCAAFTMMYAFMTSARVPLRAAIVGGCAGGLAWTAAVRAYAAYAGQTAFYTTVYGPLSAIPVFLFWLYVSWVIVLLGAQLAYAVARGAAYGEALQAAALSAASREVLALGVLTEVARRFVAGNPAGDRSAIVAALGSSAAAVETEIDRLIDHGWLCESEAGEILPAGDPHSTRIADVLANLRGSTTVPDGLEALATRHAAAEKQIRSAWGETSCADLADAGAAR